LADIRQIRSSRRRSKARMSHCGGLQGSVRDAPQVQAHDQSPTASFNPIFRSRRADEADEADGGHEDDGVDGDDWV
jgi:hypothetical protein